jgi:hypothetical protein
VSEEARHRSESILKPYEEQRRKYDESPEYAGQAVVLEDVEEVSAVGGVGAVMMGVEVLVNTTGVANDDCLCWILPVVEESEMHSGDHAEDGEET